MYTHRCRMVRNYNFVGYDHVVVQGAKVDLWRNPVLYHIYNKLEQWHFALVLGRSESG